MGREWDKQVPGVEYWQVIASVCKPGAHLLSFGGTRTWRRLCCAIEDGGWEIRDCLMWLYGMGFPKAFQVSKAIDKHLGAERERIRGVRSGVVGNTIAHDEWSMDHKDSVLAGEPVTDEAKRWNGYASALKPAWEPIILARKPMSQSCVRNVLEHGAGVLNIDGCRIPCVGGSPEYEGYRPSEELGRWPANLVLDEDAAAMLDEQAGVTEPKQGKPHRLIQKVERTDWHIYPMAPGPKGIDRGDGGGPSRFFYCTKAKKKHRDEGICHPTVKPLKLMQWLVKLLGVPDAVVLDPFAGSGTTLIVAETLGFRSIGIEIDVANFAEAKARIERWYKRRGKMLWDV
jgi:site-specific DNA-methyltransferase (adenine-specific)